MNTNDIRIELPSSKSLSIRWLLVNYLSPYNFHITNVAKSADAKVMQRIINQLKAGKNTTINCGDSALAARLLMAVLAVRPGVYTITGSDSLCQRPMGPLVEALNELEGPKVSYLGREGCLPVRVEGTVPAKKLVAIDPSKSGQYVSALLFAGSQMPEGLHIRMKNRPASQPFVAMTCKVLAEAGASNDYKASHTMIRQLPMEKFGQVRSVAIERDWSAAAFFYVAAMLLPRRRIRLVGLSLNTQQGDKAIAEVMGKLGVKTKEVRSPYNKMSSITIEGGGEVVKSLKVNVVDFIDTVPALAVACSAMGVDATLTGVKNLPYKESDRLSALAAELEKMGGKVEIGDNVLHIYPSALRPTEAVATYGDHRMAMAFGVLKILFPELEIENKEVVGKSFPDFWNQLDFLLK